MKPPSTANLDDVLAAARRLPRKAQAELAEALLHDAAESAAGEAPLEMLRGMSDTELIALSSSMVAPVRQRRMTTLLKKNQRAALRDDEREELDALLQEADRIALLKARAAYTLAQLARHRTAAA